MLDSQTTPAASASDQDLRPRARALSWMASMSVASGDLRAAEIYLVDLLTWCAFIGREPEFARADDGF